MPKRQLNLDTFFRRKTNESSTINNQPSAVLDANNSSENPTSTSDVEKNFNLPLPSDGGPEISPISSLDIGLFVSIPVSDEKRFELLRNVWKPDLTYNFPCKKDGAQNRRFNHSWLQKFPWLSYSHIKQGAFCICCVLFATREQRNQELGVLVTKLLIKYKVILLCKENLDF